MRGRNVDKLIGEVLNLQVSLHKANADIFTVEINQEDIFLEVVRELVTAVGGGMVVSYGGPNGDLNHLLCDAAEAESVIAKLVMKHTCSVYICEGSNLCARYWSEKGTGGIDAQGIFWPALERIVRLKGGLSFGKKRFVSKFREF